MATESVKEVIERNVWKDNQVIRQILGICSSWRSPTGCRTHWSGLGLMLPLPCPA